MGGVVADQLVKTYRKGQVRAVNGVSFSVEKGELFGLIGPDGAGKTSIFRMLATLLLPDGGKASVCGLDVISGYRDIRRRVGYMPGRFSLYQDLSVEENLRFFASLFRTSIRENYDLIRDIYVQIEPFRHRRAGKLSGGMKQKLALCCALIHRPEVLFLDEPTTGVDAVSRKEFWEMLARLRAAGITILVSTPYMDEATRCERIALIGHGDILTIDTPEGIVGRFPAQLFAVKSREMGRLLGDLRRSPLLSSCYAFGEYHHVTFRESDPRQPGLLTDALRAAGHQDTECRQIRPVIEDCFISLMHRYEQ